MRRVLAAAAVALTLSGCRNDRESIFASIAAPPTPTHTPVSPTLFVNGVSVFPSGVLGGMPARGTVTVSLPAPTGGVRVNLSGSGGPVSLPPAVTVPDGRQSVEFPIPTTPVGADVDVTITASGAGAVRTRTFSVWAPNETFLAWTVEGGQEPVRQASGRVLPDTNRFTGFCTDRLVWISINGPTVSANLWFQAGDHPLRPGTYENAFSPGRPGAHYLDVSLPVAGLCRPSEGRFVVQEAVFRATGQVERFSATFEARCTVDSQRVSGAIRVTNLDAGGTLNTCLR